MKNVKQLIAIYKPCTVKNVNVSDKVSCYTGIRNVCKILGRQLQVAPITSVAQHCLTLKMCK